MHYSQVMLSREGAGLLANIVQASFSIAFSSQCSQVLWSTEFRRCTEKRIHWSTYRSVQLSDLFPLCLSKHLASRSN